MDLVFNQQGNEWVAEFEATADFNLHIEREKSGYVEVYQRTAGEKYAHVKGVPIQLRYQLTIDEAFVGVVWPKTMKVVCATEPSVAVVTSDGETTQIGGGNSMIEFSVNGTTYQAEEGMTWAEFVESEYNDGTFGKMGTNYVKPSLDYEGGRVTLDSKIVAGYDYAYAPM